MPKNRFVLKDKKSTETTLRGIELEEDEDGVDVIIDGYYVFGFKNDETKVIRYYGAGSGTGLKGNENDCCLLIDRELE